MTPPQRTLTAVDGTGMGQQLIAHGAARGRQFPVQGVPVTGKTDATQPVRDGKALCGMPDIQDPVLIVPTDNQCIAARTMEVWASRSDVPGAVLSERQAMSR